MEDHPRSNLSSCEVDPKIWKLLAGSDVVNIIPSVGDHVFYFPEGHAEQSTSPPHFSKLVYERPMVLCHVVSIRFLAHPETDELFLSLLLEPIGINNHIDNIVGNGGREIEAATARNGNIDNMFNAFTKKLSPSDANNSGGFLMPKNCADSVFPALDHDEINPEQDVSLRDVSGAFWSFRHIYRGQPNRNLLTTGWSKFIAAKKLLADDRVTFTSNMTTNEYYIGIRRSNTNTIDIEPQPKQEGDGQKQLVLAEGVLSRRFLGKVLPNSVMYAAELAASNHSFHVTYYPGDGRSAIFLVNAQLVCKSLSFQWNSGVRVKLTVEPETSSSNMQLYQGTVISNSFQDNRDPWRAPSPWRMLVVEWENAENLKAEVSPWQVEPAFYPFPFPFPSPNLFYYTSHDHFVSAFFEPIPNSKRRRKCLNNSCVNDNNASTSRQSVSYAGNGMQGARQKDLQLLIMPTLPNLIRQGPKLVSTGLNTPSISSHETLGTNAAGNDMQGARQQDHQLSTIPTFPNLISQGPKSVPTGLNSPSISSHETLETNAAGNDMQGTRQQDHQLPTIPKLPSPVPEVVVPNGSNINSSSSYSTLETVTSESKNNSSNNEAISKPPPTVEESSKEDHDTGDTYSFKLFGTIIHVKVPKP